MNKSFEKMDYHFEDFTEDNYRYLLESAKNKWEFKGFCSYNDKSRTCLWRHDIDFSVHRARRLAEIEYEVGVKTTYFIDLHCTFYNALEEEIIRLVREILGFGHFLGLHFNGAAYPGMVFNKENLSEKIMLEKKILTVFFEAPVTCFSYHNPDVWNAFAFDDNKIGGLINVYGKTIRKNYFYVSDSNGYWRYHRLLDVIQKGDAERLHVLTHDTWWQRTAMSPNDRIRRCINGRAEKTWSLYETVLRASGRDLVE
jgi:hypothetical protein